MAKPTQQEKTSVRVKFKQFGMVVAFTARRDKMFLPLVALAALAIPLIVVAVVIVLGAGLLAIPIGVLGALLGFMIVLNMRAQKAMLSEAEGKPGAAAQLVENMRGDWRVRTAIAATTQYDMVHLVLGKPGVILLGEGNPSRVRGLISQERKRLAKVIGSADMRDFTIGNDEGQLSLRKLRVTLMKLPRTMTGKEVNALDKRLTALSARPQMPKGAIPKNMRPPKGAFRAMRGR